MSSEVKILDGNTFVVSDEAGDIEASLTDPTGLFSYDTRFLSKWLLTIDGQRLNPLSVDDLQYFETRFFLVPGTGTVYVDAKMSVIRQRAVDGGFREQLTILNHDDKPSDLTVRFEADSDFADLFEVKDALEKKGEYYRREDNGSLVIGYRRETYVRETRISASTGNQVDDHGLTFTVHLEPHGRWNTELTVAPGLGSLGAGIIGRSRGRAASSPQVAMQRDLDKWLQEAPRLECDWDVLKSTYRRSLVDLAALRFSPPVLGGAQPAGGRSPLVHDPVRAGQHLHQPAGPAVHLRTRGQYAHSPGHLAGHPHRRLSGRRPGAHPARAALWRDDRLRGAAPLPLLRLRGRDDALRHPPRRIRTLDGRHQAGAFAGGGCQGGAALDRRVRGPAGQRLRLLQASQ